MNEHLNERRRPLARFRCTISTQCTRFHLEFVQMVEKKYVELMWWSRRSTAHCSIRWECGDVRRMHSSLTWRWWSQNIELFIRFMTISWTSLTSQLNRLQRPQLRYTQHTRPHVFVLMRMKTTKTPSLIEYSAIPTSASRKTTTKFIYFIFLLTWTRIRNYESSMLAYAVKIEIVHAFDRTFDVGFLCTHANTQACHGKKLLNYILNLFDCQRLRATESHRCSWCS